MCAAVFLMMSSACAQAALKSEVVEYKSGGALLEGYLVYDDASDRSRPGILLVHEWTGLGDYVKGRAEQLAALGYVAFAADIYGKGIRPQNREEASQQASIYRKDRQLMRVRAMAGLLVLSDHPLVDPDRIAAIGYCFGGGVVLELARSGAGIRGVVSFHGNLDTPDPKGAENIKASVLVLHGADDPHVSWEEVKAFRDEMSAAGVDWQMVCYGNAVHSFTNPASGGDPSTGVAYNALADERSWQAMLAFFEEQFGI